MSLAESLNAAAPYKTHRGCGVGRLLLVLAPKDRDAFVAALAIGKGEPGRLSNQQLSDILKSEGHEVSMQMIETHRKGACSCGSLG